MHSSILSSRATGNTSRLSTLARKISVNLHRKQAKVFPIPTCLEQHHQFNITLVKTEQELDQVQRLVHDSYVKEGYIEPQENGKLVHFQNINQRNATHTLIAKCGDKIIGTASITMDNEYFVPIDKTFMEEYKQVRATGRKIAVIWRLVVGNNYRQHSRVVSKLIKNAINVGFTAGANTKICIFNQHHEKFYKKVLGMKVITRRDSLTCLNNLPATLMQLDKETCPSRWLIKPPATHSLAS